jgi:hypothetical protein
VVGGGTDSVGTMKEEEEKVAGRRKMETGEITDFFKFLLLISPSIRP